MDVGKVTLGGLIDRLEAAGLVKRQADPTDRRAKRVVMTPKGVKLLADIQVVATKVNARILNGIARNDISRAETVLYKMKQELIAMDAVPGGGGSNRD
jgi:DNA-binding MarR family transcriptional regulator